MRNVVVLITRYKKSIFEQNMFMIFFPIITAYLSETCGLATHER